MPAHLPLRHPDATQPEFMTRRAWWLIGANLLIPGAGPLLAGNRRFGRAALRVWLGVISALVIAAVLWFVARGALLFVLTTGWGLTILALALLGYGAWMLVTMLETLRQVKLFRVDQFARGLILLLALVLGFVPMLVGGIASAQVLRAKDAVAQLFGTANAGLKLPSDGRLNILLLGGDRGADRAGLRPDSISVMSFDALTGRLVTIGLPRTLEGFGFSPGPMAGMYPDGYGYDNCNVDGCYLNSIYTEVDVHGYDIYGDAKAHGSEPGIEATRDAVEWITGLDIHYFALVDMQGFSSLIDAMGGVRIDVAERVGMGINDDGTNPDWQPPQHWIEPGEQVMNGETALWYARSRYDTTDYARMERQRQLQDAVLSQLPGALVSKSGAILDAVDEVVETDLPPGEVGVFADLALKSRGHDDNVRLDIAPPRFDIESGVDYDAVRDAVRAAIAGELPPLPAE